VADIFNGVEIFIVYTGNVEVDDQADVSVRHIPGGNNAVIDIGGNVPGQITLELFFGTSALYQTFRAQIGKQGGLAIMQSMTTPETYLAVLVSLKRSMLNLSTTGETRATAVFQVTAG
jgi:hypothetical protein